MSSNPPSTSGGASWGSDIHMAAAVVGTAGTEETTPGRGGGNATSNVANAQLEAALRTAVNLLQEVSDSASVPEPAGTGGA